MQDYQFAKAAVFDDSYLAIADTVQPSLRQVVTTFARNMERVRAAGSSPLLMVFFAMRLQRYISEYSHKICGSYDFDDVVNATSDDANNITYHTKEEFRNELLKFGEDTRAGTIRVFNDVSPFLTAYTESSEIFGNGIEAILSGMIVGTWTAFEVLAEDLWKIAVDLKPAKLLKKIVKKEHIGFEKDVELIRFPIRLEDFEESGYKTGGRYILEGRVSELLQEGKNFKTIFGIVSAYESAFECKFESFDFSKDRSLLDLAKTRNVIVHNASIVDNDFLKTMVKCVAPRPEFRSLELGGKVPIDGNIVQNLISCAANATKILIGNINSAIS